jgi:glycosyltransferase involved in cell wall biosynthesis
LQSSAGLFYNDYEEFSAAIDYLRQHPHTRHRMGLNGQQYVRKYYSWSRIMGVYEKVLALHTPSSYISSVSETAHPKSMDRSSR